MEPATEKLDRSTTVLGAYLRWIEPVSYPFVVLVCLGLVAPWESVGFLVGGFLIPFLSLALFRLNHLVLRSRRIEDWMQSTPFFLVLTLVLGAMFLFLLALIPLGIVGLFSDLRVPAMAMENGLGRLLMSSQFAAVLMLGGLLVRLLLLASEEFRYLSREFFGAQPSNGAKPF